MKRSSINKQQDGVALLTAIFIVAIFAIIGMMNVKRAKESERISSGDVRHQTVFEAAEISLRKATTYINKANGNLIVGYAGKDSAGRTKAKNFDLDNLAVNRKEILYNPDGAIVWDKKQLRTVVCGTDDCSSGIDFKKRIDESFWKDNGVEVEFTRATDAKNYIRFIKAYVIIQKLQSVAGISAGPVVQGGEFGSSVEQVFYLIPVEAGGFPPGVSSDDARNTRENVILQAVYAKRV